MRTEIYHPSGFSASLPNGNAAERWDGVTGLYSTWDASGALLTERPLTADELAGVQEPPAPPPTLAAIAAEFANIESVADVEAFRAALEGIA